MRPGARCGSSHVRREHGRAVSDATLRSRLPAPAAASGTGGRQESVRSIGGVEPTWERVMSGVVIGACAAALGLLEVFLVPLRWGATPAPLAVVFALTGNAAAPGLMRWATQVPVTAFVPPVLWLFAVGPGTVSGPGGDVLIPGNWQGLVFLLGGVVGIVAGLAYDASRVARRQRSATGAPDTGPRWTGIKGKVPDRVAVNGKPRPGRPRSGGR